MRVRIVWRMAFILREDISFLIYYSNQIDLLQHCTIIRMILTRPADVCVWKHFGIGKWYLVSVASSSRDATISDIRIAFARLCTVRTHLYEPTADCCTITAIAISLTLLCGWCSIHFACIQCRPSISHACLHETAFHSSLNIFTLLRVRFHTG